MVNFVGNVGVTASNTITPSTNSNDCANARAKRKKIMAQNKHSNRQTVRGFFLYSNKNMVHYYLFSNF